VSNVNSIIFSRWTRTLHLLSKHLDQAKIPYLRIDGSCSLLKRQVQLDQFAKDEKRPVLIMTTGTGAFGYVSMPWLFSTQPYVILISSQAKPNLR
jgi:SWI/SNF-related matrix-associated actin-dependent regulator of chromatin subfamily A3